VDPTNLPLGSNAIYEDPTDPRWEAFRQDPLAWSWWNNTFHSTSVLSEDPPRRNVYRWDGSKWALHATIRIDDSVRWSQQTVEKFSDFTAPEAGDNTVQLIHPDGLRYDVLFNVFRYDKFRELGGPVIDGAVDKDLVISTPKAGDRVWINANLRGYCWKSIDGSVPPIGAMRGTKINCLRSGEQTAPDGLGIDHALLLFAPGGLKKIPAPGGRNWVWPADGADGSPPGAHYGGQGNIYQGSLFALPPDLDLTTFQAAQSAIPGLETLAGWNVARAMQDYGAYLVEGTGDAEFKAGYGAMRFAGDYEIVLTDLGGYKSPTHLAAHRDYLRIMAKCKIVANSHVNGGPPAPDENGYLIPPCCLGTPRRPWAQPL